MVVQFYIQFQDLKNMYHDVNVSLLYEWKLYLTQGTSILKEFADSVN